MPTYALTGELASGKTTVLRFLRSKGALVFNADERVHQYYRNKKSKVYARVVRAFPGVVSGGVISRKALASEVFSRKQSLRLLESIIHPAIIKDLQRWLTRSRRSDPQRICVAEVPLLFEKKLEGLFDKVIFIRVSREAQRARIRGKYKSQAAAAARLKFFMPVRKKISKADYVIENSSTRKALHKEVVFLWESLKKSGSRRIRGVSQGVCR